MEVRRICERKENVLTEILGDVKPLIPPEFPKFMATLASNKVAILNFNLSYTDLILSHFWLTSALALPNVVCWQKFVNICRNNAS